jgi:hypothetical protein
VIRANARFDGLYSASSAVALAAISTRMRSASRGSSVGFYIRKSVKAGPFRFNLSKSQQLDQRVGRYNRTIVQPEHREDGARFGARDCDGRAEVPKPPVPSMEAYPRQQSSVRRFNAWSRSSKAA